MKKYRIMKYLIVAIAFILSGVTTVNTAAAAESKVSATISSDKVLVGKTLAITSKTKDVTYKSSDTNIAYVNTKGIIIGKKNGQAVISVNKQGYTSKKFTVTVNKNGKKPAIPVWYEELQLVNSKVTADGQFTARVKNSSKGTVTKVIYTFQTDVLVESEEPSEDGSDDTEPVNNEGAAAGETEENAADGLNGSDTPGTTSDNTVPQPTTAAEKSTADKAVQESDTKNNKNTGNTETKIVTEKKTVKLTFTKIGAGKTSGYLKSVGPASKDIKDMKLQKVQIYSGDVLITYNALTDKYAYTWGTKDTKAPVITGMVGKNSYNNGEIYMVVYPDKKYDFTKYVHASDDRDAAVKLTVDTTGINYKKEGIYTVTYTAKDSAGNASKARAKVQVRLPVKIDSWADQVLKGIVKDSWSDEKKAVAVYTYIRKNITYVDHSDKSSWEKATEYGLKYKSGDCFTYYSTAKLLLTRLGIPNIMIVRSQGEGHHWWNLVYVEEGWYHYDTTPRKVQALFCLLTDAQLTYYSDQNGGLFIWDSSKYPERSDKQIRELIFGRRY
ncbi:MAG: transglutaminase domain protein [Anaerocolumna sp.]|jgi:hypothetical protein|nr:transglutaminase domain protein [Anaerocolumna sp.]